MERMRGKKREVSIATFLEGILKLRPEKKRKIHSGRERGQAAAL